jgi:hypothetical protein
MGGRKGEGPGRFKDGRVNEVGVVGAAGNMVSSSIFFFLLLLPVCVCGCVDGGHIFLLFGFVFLCRCGKQSIKQKK